MKVELQHTRHAMLMTVFEPVEVSKWLNTVRLLCWLQTVAQHSVTLEICSVIVPPHAEADKPLHRTLQAWQYLIDLVTVIMKISRQHMSSFEF